MKKLSIAALAVCMVLSLACFMACANKNLVLSAKDGITLVKPGATVELSVTGADEAEYKITAGGEYGTINAATGVLTVNETAKAGSKISVVATSGSLTSNVLEITVDSADLTAITATAESNVVKIGGEIVLNARLTPSNASGEIEWKVTEGSDYCVVENNILKVKEDVAVGTVIKVKAVCGKIESNELSFTAVAESNLMLVFKSDEVELDVNNSQATKSLIVNTFRDGKNVTDVTVEYTVIEGADYLEIEQNGLSCALKAKAHGEAKVKVTAVGTTASAVATVKVIVPPAALTIPEAFEKRTNYNFSYGMRDPLDFAVTAVGTGVCADYNVSFSNAKGESGLAKYENGKITFNKTGLITVTVTSDSGSKIETRNSYTFDVNDGYNVKTFEELKNLVKSSDYKGQIINIVNLDTDVLIPESLKVAKDKQVYNDIAADRIIAINKDFCLKGNNYTLDTSAAKADGVDGYGPTIEVYQSLKEGVSQSSVGYKAEISDLTLLGNNGYQSDEYYKEENGGKEFKRQMRAIVIGQTTTRAIMYPTVRNVKIVGFKCGMRVNHAINGLIENVTVENCYDNGLEICASIVTIKDMTYRLCGAFGIEMTPDKCKEAGKNFDEKQRITFEGNTLIDNANTGDSPYLQNYFMGMLDTIIQSNLLPYKEALENNGAGKLFDELVGNIKSEDGYQFYALLFNNVKSINDPNDLYNETEFTYGNQDDNFLIDFADIAKNASTGTCKDTTHRFVTMTVYVNAQVIKALTSLDVAEGNYPIGRVIFYNFNYVGA